MNRIVRKLSDFFVSFRCSILGRWQGMYQRNIRIIIIIIKEYASQQECTDQI